MSTVGVTMAGMTDENDAEAYPRSPVPSDRRLWPGELPFTAFGQFGENMLDLRVFGQEVGWVDRRGRPHLIAQISDEYIANVISVGEHPDQHHALFVSEMRHASSRGRQRVRRVDRTGRPASPAGPDVLPRLVLPGRVAPLSVRCGGGTTIGYVSADGATPSSIWPRSPSPTDLAGHVWRVEGRASSGSRAGTRSEAVAAAPAAHRVPLGRAGPTTQRWCLEWPDRRGQPRPRRR